MTDLLNPRNFRRWLVWTLCIPMAGALAFTAILIAQIERQTRSAELVDHGDVVIANADDALKAILDQETGIRGFLITGHEEFLTPYNSGSLEAETRLRQLDQLTRNNPQQQQQLAVIRERYATWKRYAARALTSPRTEARSYETEIGEKQAMDSIRTALSIFVRREEEMRELRMERSRETTRTIYIYVGGFSIFFSILMGVLSVRRLHRLAEIYGEALQLAEQRARQLHMSQQWFSTTLASIGDGVIATDAEGRIVFMNNPAKILTGWDDDAKGKPIDDVFRVVGEVDRKPVESPFEKVRRLGTVIGLANHTALVRKDGTEFAIADSGAPIRDDAGALLGVVVVFSDISGRREAERILRTTEQFAALGRLAASVAHEIHNPLDAVGNAIFLLQKSGKLDEQSSMLVELAAGELAKANQISRNVLSLYRQAAAPVLVNVAELIENAIGLLLGKMREKSIEFRRNFQFEGSVFGFPTELRQVLVNLIANAIDASSKGGAIEIHSAMSVLDLGHGKKSALVIQVKDEGSGIAVSVLPKLFQAFMTTKGENGTGLGLWVSRSIVEKHGGTLTAQSREDRAGAIFTICLPAGPAHFEIQELGWQSERPVTA